MGNKSGLVEIKYKSAGLTHHPWSSEPLEQEFGQEIYPKPTAVKC